METFLYKIALKVVTKPLKLQDMAAWKWEDGYKNTSDFSELVDFWIFGSANLRKAQTQ